MAALRAVFGPADKLESIRERERQPENHQEVMSGSGNRGGDQGTDEQNAERPPKGLSRRELSYYEGQITKGIYRDWNAVRVEMKHSNPGLRQRMGARLGVTH